MNQFDNNNIESIGINCMDNMCRCEEHVQEINRVCCGLVVCLPKSPERSFTVKPIVHMIKRRTSLDEISQRKV